MVAEKSNVTVELADCEVILRRKINAPRELVFDAWTKAEHMERWFGPHGFRTTATSDPRPGGKFRIVMHATDALPPEFAGDYPMFGIYQEFVRPERIVFTSDVSEHSEQWKTDIKKACGTDSDDVLHSVATVTFEDFGGKTLITIRSRFASNAIRDGYVKTGMNEGWEQSLERLETLVADPLVIERVFDAPIERVWSVITDVNEMKQWYFKNLTEFKPVVGFKTEVMEGGKPHAWEVTEAIPKKKIQYNWSYPGYEGTSKVSFELFGEDGKTRLRLTHEGLSNFPASEPMLARHNFVMGWTSLIGNSLPKHLARS